MRIERTEILWVMSLLYAKIAFSCIFKVTFFYYFTDMFGLVFCIMPVQVLHCHDYENKS